MVRIDDVLANIAAGLQLIFGIETWLAVLVGVLLGLVVGVIPGLSATMAIALLSPITFFLPPLVGLPFLIGIYKGAEIGSFIPAILIRTPGTNASAATLLDGYPLSQKGYPNKALHTALAASVTADLLSDLLLLFTAPFLGLVAVALGAPERFSIIVLSIILIGAFVGESPVKGIASALVGLLISTVGVDQITGARRFVFGVPALSEGIDVLPALIGMFALAEVMRMVARGHQSLAMQVNGGVQRSDDSFTWEDYKEVFPTILRGTAIGSLIGAAPGLGPSVAAFLSYGIAKRRFKNPEEFGKGTLHGIAASESGNSAVYGPNLIPLLTLGIPGSLVAAVLYGAFIVHGLQPGPRLFEEQAPLLYAVILSLVFANVVMYSVGRLFLKPVANVVRLPRYVLAPTIVLFTVAGSFAFRNSWLDVWVMVCFGMIGFVMDRFGYPTVPLIIALILGRSLENSLIQSLILFRGNVWGFFSYPIATVALALAAGLVIWSVVKVYGWRDKEGANIVGSREGKDVHG